MLPLFVVVPLAAAFTIPILSALRRNFAQWLAIICGGWLLLLSIKSISWLKSGIKVYAVGNWQPPFGICMELDGLTVLMLLVVNLIGFLAILYSFDYAKKYSSPKLYYTLFCLLLAGLNGVVISGDLFNMFVFLEIASIASYSLVAFGAEAEELEAAFKYLVLGSVASAFILLAIAMLLGGVSTLNMADISRSLNMSSSANLILFSLALFIMGFGLKTGLVPFHAWLPDAHPAAPAPVSAMLSGVVIKTLGVYALVRVIFNIIGFTPLIGSLLAGFGILSMVFGALLSLGQWDLKRLLAYSSISQVGYVIFGISLGTPLGIIGGLFHLFNHSLFKSLLFFNAGSLEQATGTRMLDKYGGLSKEMPVTAATSMAASLSIIGIPPMCGFWSKLIIIIAAFEAGNIFGALTCIAVAVITLAIFLKFQKHAFLRKGKEDTAHIKEAGVCMRSSMIILALLCFAVGVMFHPFVNKIVKPAADMLLEGKGYANIVLKDK
ncbi:MAG: proton-conducting transporter membrane subunit [Candidatus Omnitrophota bacterium]